MTHARELRGGARACYLVVLVVGVYDSIVMGETAGSGERDERERVNAAQVPKIEVLRASSTTKKGASPPPEKCDSAWAKPLWRR